jgi:hypothetical protein
MKKIFISFFIFFFSLAVFVKNCSAETEEKVRGFSIDPFFQEVTIQPEQKESQFFLTVENTTETPAIFHISVLDFGALDESGGVAFLGASDLERKYGLASWISLEIDALVINPNEKQQVRVTIENKESLSPGGHYAALFLKMDSDEKSSGNEKKSSEVAFNPSLASLIFVRKLGGEIYGMDFKEQELQNNLWKNPASIKLRFQNTGNTHIAPRGVIKIIDPLGREVIRGIINPESAIILPETFRVFPVALKKIALSFLPGRYTLSIEYRYDGKEEFMIDKSRFTFIPPISIAAGLILIAGIMGYIKLRNKKNKEAKDKK